MPPCYNPSLSEEPRSHAMKVVPPIARETLLNWLESSGRLRSQELDEFQDHKVPEDLDDFLDVENQIPDDEEDSEDSEED